MASESSRNTRFWIIGALVIALVVIAAGVIGILADSDEPPPPFGGLTAEHHVYDDTSDSLSADQRTSIEARIADIEQRDNIEIVAYVRGLDASPDDTLDQVADLQKQWASAADVNEERTVALLINRNPDDPNDARAGIYAGDELVDDLLTEDDQGDIVDEALIPPLTEGDVAVSLLDGLGQIDATLAGNATPDAFERWAASAGRTWVPWVSLGLSGLLALYALLVFRRRERAKVVKPPPSTVRPNDLAPAVGGALALGGAAATALPATIIDLAGRGVLVLEPDESQRDESEAEADPGVKAVQIRLIDEAGLRGPVDRAVWKELQDQAGAGVVRGKALTTASQQIKPVMAAVRYDLTQRGWMNPAAPRARTMLGVVAALAGLLALADFVVLIAGEEPLMTVGLVPAVALAAAALTMSYRFSRFSTEGQHAAVSWQAYRHGLQEAAKDPRADLDLDIVVPDLIATGQSGAVEALLEQAGERGDVVAAFAGLGRGAEAAAMAPFWVIYSGAFIGGGAGSAGTVTGTVGGSGGGAAGST